MQPIDFDLIFNNEHTIYEKIIICEIDKDEFNISYNPSLLTDPKNLDSDLLGFTRNKDFKPYVTTIGVYNDEGDLIMVAKTAQPVPLSVDHNITFILKIDS